MTLVLLFWLAAADDLYNRGTQAISQGQMEQAVQLLTEAAKTSPGDAQVWKALGVAYAATGNHEAATEPFRQACTLRPSLPDACYYYGRNLYALNRFAPALDALRKAPKEWRVTLAVAQAHEALGEAERAQVAFSDAIRQQAGKPASPDFDPRLHYAVFLYRQGRTAEAKAPAEAALAQHPTSGRAHFEVGRICYALGELETAASHLEQAVKLGYGGPAHLLLGKTYMRLGKTEAAQQHLNAAPAQ